MLFVFDCDCTARPSKPESERIAATEKEPLMETSHATALHSKHAGLEARIRDEQKRPHPDGATIHELKKKKLRIKEELAHI